MKDFKNCFYITFLLCFYNITVQAQTFTEQVQQRKNNEGVVTIVQSKDINDLVNGTKQTANSATTTSVATPKKPSITADEPTTKATTSTPTHSTDKQEEVKTHTTNKPDSSAKKETIAKEIEKSRTGSEQNDKDFDIPVIDMRKKVMVNSYKVNGYRVQVFAGGNSRVDRQKAENIGNKLKMEFPTEPIYVHFYSPRWICRMGNYRSYEEANKILKQIQRMGYKQACLVQGKITIQY